MLRDAQALHCSFPIVPYRRIAASSAPVGSSAPEPDSIRWIVPSFSTTNVVRLASLMKGIRTLYCLETVLASSLRMGNCVPSASANFLFLA